MNIMFKSPDENYFLKLNNKILYQMQNECLKVKNIETGGILIGKYLSQNEAIVKKITGPPKDSKLYPTKFEIGNHGLISLLDKEWKLGNYYIGDWHYHPNSLPKPSRVDDKQMQKYAKDILLKCPKPILIILGGNKKKWKISVTVYTKHTKTTLNQISRK